jgi:CRP-like cAMP-binding protein
MAMNGADRFPEGSTLHACGPGGCAALAKHWTEATYPARALIVSEDETDDDVFFILSGRARAATYTDTGKEVLMSELRARAATYTDTGKEVLMSELPPGESFGIFAAIDGQPRSTNVIAIEDARIARMSADNFNKVLYSHSGVTRAFIHYLVERIRHLSTRMTAVTTQDAEHRLIAELLRLAEDGMTGPDSARKGAHAADQERRAPQGPAGGGLISGMEWGSPGNGAASACPVSSAYSCRR